MIVYQAYLFNAFYKLILLKVTRFSRSPREVLNVAFGETLQLNYLIQAWGNFEGFYYDWQPGQDWNQGTERIVDKILSYGCYCQLRNFERYKNLKEGIVPGNKIIFFYLRKKNLIGEGTPVDALDEACMNWHKCQACTKIDDNQCNQRVRYEVDYLMLKNYEKDTWPYWPRAPEPDCSANTNICDFGRCSCDVELATRLSSIIVNNFNYYQDLSKLINHEFVTNEDGSGFDHKNRCKNTSPKPPGSGTGSGSGSLSPDISCCGDYPHRQSYSTFRQTCCGKGEVGAKPFLVVLGAC